MCAKAGELTCTHCFPDMFLQCEKGGEWREWGFCMLCAATCFHLQLRLPAKLQVPNLDFDRFLRIKVQRHAPHDVVF